MLPLRLHFSAGFVIIKAMKRIIQTDFAPKAIGPYSQGIAAGDFIFFSGQIPIDPATGKLAGDGIVE